MLVETYGAKIECPFEDCPFYVVIGLCRSEEEARTLFMQMARTHARFQHGDEEAFDPKVYVIEMTPYAAAERRPLEN